MRSVNPLLRLLPMIWLAACGEEQPPTAPVEPVSSAVSQTAGHKVVNSVADPGDGVCNAAQCTLREAIKDPTSTLITFAPGLTGPITLARPGRGGILVIERALTITGPAGGITIRRASADPAFRIFRIGSDGDVTLSNLTIRNGRADLGGGIINFGTLRLTHVTVAGNFASDRGGGIDNHGTLTLTNSTVARNTASIGGGILNRGEARLTISGSVVNGNAGGGIFDDGGHLAVSNSTVAGNVDWGGIAQSWGVSTLTNVQITGNRSDGSGGGFVIFRNGRLMLTNSTVARNSAGGDGGGLSFGLGSKVTIDKSTIVGNSAAGDGGGISNTALLFGRVDATVQLTNSTVSGNSATRGGGIFNRNFPDEAVAFLTLLNSTVTDNSATQEGGGIDLVASSLTLVNSLVAGNQAPLGPDVRQGTEAFVTARFNLVGDGTGSGLTNVDGNKIGNVSPNSAPIDPLLVPLADNGGSTGTYALLPGSPAIDAGSTADCQAADQRGVQRPQGTGCDIGSFEK